MKSRRLVLAASVAVLTVGVAVAGLYLFRTTVEARADGAVVRHTWRWGMAYSASIDRDGDGRIDILAFLQPGLADFYTDVPPREVLLDLDLDGRFDHRLVYAAVDRLELDVDGDGEFETTLTGSQVGQYFRDHPGLPIAYLYK